MKVTNADVSVDDILAEGNIRSFRGNDQPMLDLIASVSAVGVLEPVLLTPRKGAPPYQLVSGFRRHTAACAAGIDTLPARILHGLTEAQVIEVRLSENIHRLNMNPMEEAVALRDYIAKTGVNQADAAKRLGRDQFWVSTRLRLLQLPELVQKALREGRMPVANAIALLPFVGKVSDTWLSKAGAVGAEMSTPRFSTYLDSAKSKLETKIGYGARSDPTECKCSCTCCRRKGTHRSAEIDIA